MVDASVAAMNDGVTDLFSDDEACVCYRHASLPMFSSNKLLKAARDFDLLALKLMQTSPSFQFYEIFVLYPHTQSTSSKRRLWCSSWV
jgi:hypothetical protein